MTFLVWRQYRLQWTIALALLAAFAAMVLVDGLHTASAWHSILTGCAAAHQAGPGAGCADHGIVSQLGNDLRILSVIVPAILGALWGAPLVAHETEAGTTNFAWTQAVTRTRWLAAKVGLLMLSAALWAAAVSALVTWWSGPVNAQQGQAFAGPYFDEQGIAPIGYAAFAMALGITAGALLRRTLPAIAVTLGGFIGVRALFDSVIRPHLMPAVTTITGLTGPTSTWSPPGISWTLNSGAVNAAGLTLNGWGPFDVLGNDGNPLPGVPAACAKLATNVPLKGFVGQDPVNALGSCLSNAGFKGFITYQPGYRYWPFQGIETGIYVALAAALLAVTFYVIRRRDA